MLLLDFGLSTIVSVVALVWNNTSYRYTFKGIVLDVMLIGVMLIATSLVYEIYNFRKLHKLHTDIEDAVITEENPDKPTKIPQICKKYGLQAMNITKLCEVEGWKF